MFLIFTLITMKYLSLYFCILREVLFYLQSLSVAKVYSFPCIQRDNNLRHLYAEKTK